MTRKVRVCKNFTYYSIIKEAILSEKNQKATSTQIFSYITNKHPQLFKQSNSMTWKGNIRQLLSKSPEFVKLPKDEVSKLHYWKFVPIEEIIENEKNIQIKNYHDDITYMQNPNYFNPSSYKYPYTNSMLNYFTHEYPINSPMFHQQTHLYNPFSPIYNTKKSEHNNCCCHQQPFDYKFDQSIISGCKKNLYVKNNNDQSSTQNTNKEKENRAAGNLIKNCETCLGVDDHIRMEEDTNIRNDHIRMDDHTNIRDDHIRMNDHTNRRNDHIRMDDHTNRRDDHTRLVKDIKDVNINACCDKNTFFDGKKQTKTSQNDTENKACKSPEQLNCSQDKTNIMKEIFGDAGQLVCTINVDRGDLCNRVVCPCCKSKSNNNVSHSSRSNNNRSTSSSKSLDLDYELEKYEKTEGENDSKITDNTTKEQVQERTSYSNIIDNMEEDGMCGSVDVKETKGNTCSETRCLQNQNGARNETANGTENCARNETANGTGNGARSIINNDTENCARSILNNGTENDTNNDTKSSTRNGTRNYTRNVTKSSTRENKNRQVINKNKSTGKKEGNLCSTRPSKVLARENSSFIYAERAQCTAKKENRTIIYDENRNSTIDENDVF